MKVVINKCFGGFGLSEAAYEKLIEWGIPVRAHVETPRDPKTGLYTPQAENDAAVIFDRSLTPKQLFCTKEHIKFFGRYWETWLAGDRTHPLLIRVVEEMGAGHRTGASGSYANLAVVEIPDGTDYTIEEYDGKEHVAEVHNTWE
jgi:hypothetical protein